MSLPRREGRVSLGRPGQRARERRVKSTRDGGHTLITELTESCRWLVVLEDPMSGVVFVKHHPNRRIERGRKPMPRHKRGCDGIADVVLERITRFAGNLQYRTMVTELE